MFMMIALALAALLVVVVLFALSGRREQADKDLGTISPAWIAQHRAATYDATR